MFKTEDIAILGDQNQAEVLKTSKRLGDLLQNAKKSVRQNACDTINECSFSSVYRILRFDLNCWHVPFL